jgi:hypothetical protein
MRSILSFSTLSFGSQREAFLEWENITFYNG